MINCLRVNSASLRRSHSEPEPTNRPIAEPGALIPPQPLPYSLYFILLIPSSASVHASLRGTSEPVIGTGLAIGTCRRRNAQFNTVNLNPLQPQHLLPVHGIKEEEGEEEEDTNRGNKRGREGRKGPKEKEREDDPKSITDTVWEGAQLRIEISQANSNTKPYVLGYP